MKEQGIYVGDDTLTAHLARQRRLYEGLRGNAARRIVTIIGAVLGKAAPGLTNQAPEVGAFAKAVLRWRGCNHETHTLSRRTGSFSPGLVIRNNLGLPVEYISDKRMKELRWDDEFAQIYLEEQLAEGLL